METEQKIIFKRHAKEGIEKDVDDHFDIVLPKKNIIFLLIIFLFLLAGEFYYFYGENYIQLWFDSDPIYLPKWAIGFIFVGVFLVLSFAPLMLWAKIGPKIGEHGILRWLKKVSTRGKKKTDPIEYFVGFPRTKDMYYIESNSMDLDMSNTAVFIKRIQEVVFLSIGVSVTVARFLAEFFYANLEVKWEYDFIEEMIMDTAIWLGPFALLLLFPVMPLIWLTADCQVYRIDSLQDTYRIGSYLKAGLLSKILGYFGILLAFDLAKEFSQLSLLRDLGAEPSTILLYGTTVYNFLLIILASSAAPFIITLIYLLKFHGRYVNNLRIRASAFLPCGMIQINYAPPSELQYLTHPEKIEEKKGFFSKPFGIVLIVLLALVAGIFCFYLGFLY